LTPEQLLPDGLGGLLIRGRWTVGSQVEGKLIRLDDQGQRTDHAISLSARVDLVGQAGTVYLQTRNGNDFYSTTQALDVTTWTPRWTASPGWNLLAAAPDGGASALSGSGALLNVDHTGQQASSAALGIADPIQQFGNWIGQGAGDLKALAGDFSDATRWDATLAPVGVGLYEPRGFGDGSGSLQTRRPGTGIFVKSHLAEDILFGMIRYRHLSVRVTPHDQVAWTPYLAQPKDPFGNRFFTFGAGPIGGDTAWSCNGTLVAGVNRQNDVAVPPLDPLELLTYPLQAENLIIQDLIDRHLAYDNDLPYACFPENDPGFYNSNSFAAGLLNAVRLGQPRKASRVPALFPGVQKPVPLPKFQ
jgi:hypothetical protein